MKNRFLILFLLFSIGISAQVVIKTPNVTALDTFKGKFSKIEMKKFPVNDTLTEEERNRADETFTITYNSSGQKSSVRFEFPAYDDNSADTFIYDRNGKLLEESENSIIGHGYDYFFNADGKKIYAVEYEPESDAGYDTMKYDPKGNLIFASHYGQVIPQGSFDYFYYNKAGKMYRMESHTNYFFEDGEIFQKDSVHRTYNIKGKLLSEKLYSVRYSKPIKGKYTERVVRIIYKATYTYSDKGKIITEKTEYPQESKTKTDRFEFSNSGLLLSELEIESRKDKTGKQEIDSVLTINKYDSLGFVMTTSQKTKDRIFNWKYETIYNSDGNPISCEEYFDDKKIALYKWEYSR